MEESSTVRSKHTAAAKRSSWESSARTQLTSAPPAAPHAPAGLSASLPNRPPSVAASPAAPPGGCLLNGIALLGTRHPRGATDRQTDRAAPKTWAGPQAAEATAGPRGRPARCPAGSTALLRAAARSTGTARPHGVRTGPGPLHPSWLVTAAPPRSRTVLLHKQH